MNQAEDAMLFWSLIFLIVAVIAGILVFGGVESAPSQIARVLFFIFIVVFVVIIIANLVR